MFGAKYKFLHVTHDDCFHFNSYGEVKQAIMKTPLIAPAYYILGGARAGEVLFLILNQYCTDITSFSRNYHLHYFSGHNRAFQRPAVLQFRVQQKCVVQ